MDDEGRERKPFELFGLTWHLKPFIPYGQWSGWTELDSMSERVESLQAMFVDPPWVEFEARVDVREYEAAMIQLWGAVRMPPDQGEA